MPVLTARPVRGDEGVSFNDVANGALDIYSS